MTQTTICAWCASEENLKRCSRCKEVSYCCKTCQRTHWPGHKSSCKLRVASDPAEVTSAVDALSLLRSMPNVRSSSTQVPSATQRTFDISELRLAIFSLLPARDLLLSQRVSRSWYLAIALEHKLQQRLFLAPGPGELVMPAGTGQETYPGIHPRDSNQRERLAREKGSERWSNNDHYLMTFGDGRMTPLTTLQVEQTGSKIILKPVFTMLWEQDPMNMTLNPNVRASAKSSPNASWRNMQITSPPMRSLGMNLWYSHPEEGGNQLVPYTGHIASGVTMGHVADMLAAQPRKYRYHWMWLHGHASWLLSADAMVVPNEKDVDEDESDDS